MLVVVGIALTMSFVAVRPVLFERTTSAKTKAAIAQVHAEVLLPTAVRGGRILFAAHHSFKGISAAALSAHASRIPIVAATTSASVGQVSMWVTSAQELTLATPTTSGRCVFARDVPSMSTTRYATVVTAHCRASATPATGWTP